MKNKEVLDKLFGKHSAYYYINKLRGLSCRSCMLKSFCDSYYRNRPFTSCGECGSVFLEEETLNG